MVQRDLTQSRTSDFLAGLDDRAARNGNKTAVYLRTVESLRWAKARGKIRRGKTSHASTTSVHHGSAASGEAIAGMITGMRREARHRSRCVGDRIPCRTGRFGVAQVFSLDSRSSIGVARATHHVAGRIFCLDRKSDSRQASPYSWHS